MKNFITIFIVIMHIFFAESAFQVFYLEHSDEVQYEGKRAFDVYCYKGKPKYMVYIWQSVFLQIGLNSDKYEYYEGTTPEIVHHQYEEHHSSWGINLFSLKYKSFKLNPFNQSCIGIESNEKFVVRLQVVRVDYWKVLLLMSGLVLLFFADKLSRNILFYYICGITLGICTSFLIAIYFISKLFPRRSMMYGAAICGWTVGIYVFQLLWDNMRIILLKYQFYVVWYGFITGIISFIVCYRWGPVTNERTKNLIQWSLQSTGLVAIFNSSQFQEAAVGQIILLLTVYNFPQTWIMKSKTYWKRKFPPKVKLLSNDEYYRQGVTETAKALEELRSFCSSPDCNQWKTATRLKDLKRFAGFLEGTSHLSDDEILEYETSICTTNLTDDEEELLTDEEL